MITVKQLVSHFDDYFENFYCEFPFQGIQMHIKMHLLYLYMKISQILRNIFIQKNKNEMLLTITAKLRQKLLSDQLRHNC